MYSFKKLNPDWQIKIYYPKVNYEGENTWQSQEHFYKFTGENYFDRLLAMDVEKIQVDFSQASIDSNIPESFKADFLRWHILANEGGLWSDFDIIYFKPMDSLVFNSQANSNTDTFVCINDSRVYYRHLIGFLMSSPNNDFYRFVLQQAYSRLDLKNYQSIGSLILNAHFQSIQSARFRFRHLHIANIDLASVYPLNELNIPLIYHTNDLSAVTGETIGIHWYAGHPEAGIWENAVTESSYKNYDNGLSQIIGQVI